MESLEFIEMVTWPKSQESGAIFLFSGDTLDDVTSERKDLRTLWIGAKEKANTG